MSVTTRMLQGIGVGSFALLGHAIAEAASGTRDGRPADVHGCDAPMPEPLCPRTWERQREPEVTEIDVDEWTLHTDHACSCGRIHRFYHDGEDVYYDRDVSVPGEGVR